MPRKQTGHVASKRQYWFWVTRPEYYLDEDGKDREDLDPDSGVDSDGWWTCHKDTQRGDLILLWRTSPRSDIGYLIQSGSDAYSIADKEGASEQGWDYGCDYQVLYKFRRPLTIEDVRKSPYLEELSALKARFQGRVFRIPPEHWQRLTHMAAEKDRMFKAILPGLEKDVVSQHILLEEDLEEKLATNLSILRDFGHLKLYKDPAIGCEGRQVVCTGNGGRIDLLCYDSRKRRFVVIELKVVRAGQNTFGQISNYMGWVQQRIAHGKQVIGLVISRGYDTRFESALKVTHGSILHLDVKNLGFE